jgi:3-hydroxybutyrate dehydrogenase
VTAPLAGRHALVTGGGRGIGLAIAAALTGAGAAVTVAGRNEAALVEAVTRGSARGYMVADVTDARAVADGIARAETAAFGKGDPDLFRRMFELNVMGTVHAVREVLDGMTVRGFGRVVAIASTAGLKGYGYVSAYCAAKHAVVGLVRALAIETAASGITVNAVCPGYTDTDLVQSSLVRITAKTGRSRDDALAMMLKASPLGRLVKPQEVAAAVLFLCSPGAEAITGTTLAVAGGEV